MAGIAEPGSSAGTFAKAVTFVSEEPDINMRLCRVAYKRIITLDLSTFICLFQRFLQKYYSVSLF
jgi:hypothetical protein